MYISFLQKRDIAEMRKSITTMNKVSWKEHAEILKELSMKAAKEGDIDRLKVLHNIGATFSSEECNIAITKSHYECVQYIAGHLIESGKYEKYIEDICNEGEERLDCLMYCKHKTAMRSIRSYSKSYTNRKESERKKICW
jgi:hypothetical protein